MKSKADQLRAAADAMDKHIVAKHQSARNMLALPPTRKRTQDGEGIRQDALTLEKTQAVLRRLADMHDAGTITASIASLNSRAAVDRLRWQDGPIREMFVAADRPVTAAERLEKIERDVLLTKIPGFFPTRAPAVNRMLELAKLSPGMKVLEPSAGTGRIADAARNADAEVHVVEINASLREILRLKGHMLLPEPDFLKIVPLGFYDRVLMNAPFENQQDIDHVVHAYAMLRPGGLLVAITSGSWMFRDSRKAEEFRAWFRGILGTIEDLPSGSFDMTGCPGKLITIEKPGRVREPDEVWADIANPASSATVSVLAHNFDSCCAAPTGDPEHGSRLDAERVTLEFRSRSTRRIDGGTQPITDGPLFGGPSQQNLF
jgi:protein-L-isoaspartate O-methyltransferase